MKYSAPLKEIAKRVREAAGPDDHHRVHNHGVVVHFDRLASAVQELENLQASRDPTVTSAAHAQKVAAAAKRLEGRISSLEDTLYKQLQSSAETLTRQIDDRAGLVENQYAAEIRTAFRAMKPADRQKALNEAVLDGDSATVAALASAPSVVTGLDPQFTQKMTDHFRQQAAPELYQAMSDLADGLPTVNVAVKSARAACRQAQDAKQLAEIESQQAAAAEAQARFDQALS